MDTICSGEQNPSAGFEHVLSCSLTTCFENYFENSHTHLFCVADGSGRAGSSLLSDIKSVFFQKLKQTGV